jgi:hypothetical protein
MTFLNNGGTSPFPESDSDLLLVVTSILGGDHGDLLLGSLLGL